MTRTEAAARTYATTIATTIAAAVAAAALLAACGGGGGDPGGKTNITPPAPAPTQQLAGYVGTWVADCAGHARETDVITQASSGTITVARQTDYYTGADCSGLVVATQTQSANVTATFTGTTDVSIALPPSTTPTAIKVDLVSAAVGPYTVSVTGTGVTHTNCNAGKPGWRIDFAINDSTCIPDDGAQAGSSTTTGLYVNGNQLYELTQTGLTYVVTQHLTKK